MIGESYQKVFHEYTKTLDQVVLGQLCVIYDVKVPLFLSWCAACKVRQAKMQEITEARVVAMEKSK